MSKNIYQKEFTRDFSVIMEEVWFYAFSSGIEKYFDFKKLSAVPLVFYSHSGTIEVWSNGKIIAACLNKMNQAVKKQPEFFTAVLDDYEKQLKSLNIIFKSRHLKTKQELDKFIKSIFKIITPFAIMYYLAEDGLGNGKIVNRARTLRHQDSFYEDCDNFLRRSLLFLYPKLKGLEALVTSSEIKTIPKLTILQARYKGFVFIPGNFKKAETLKKFSEHHSNFIFAPPKINFDNKIFKGISAGGGAPMGDSSGRIQGCNRFSVYENMASHWLVFQTNWSILRHVERLMGSLQQKMSLCHSTSLSRLNFCHPF